MTNKMTFGNKKYGREMEIGGRSSVKLLTNIGHMSSGASFNDEIKKAELAVKYGVDILADNTVTEKSFVFKKWIKENLPVFLNTVPVYECFDEMESGTFEYSQLEEVIDRHIDIGSDMIVTHPTMTKGLAKDVYRSSRIIKVTSRGGSQMYRYLLNNDAENPYYVNWDKLCDKLSGTGVAIAIGLSLRSGSILDCMDELFIKELDIAGKLIERALAKDVPIVIEGMGHIKEADMNNVFMEVQQRCHGVPIKTLGPLLSDRMIGNEHINALLGSYSAVKAGASIIGALFRSEHLGLPSIEEYEESLINYKMLKYIVNMTEDDLEKERMISIARSNREWSSILECSFYPEEAVKQFHRRYGENNPENCTMCGERCALKEY